jgi:hypothetical protein
MGYEGTMVYTVTGTDSVGNVLPISRSIEIDTLAPAGPEVTGYSANVGGGGTQNYEAFDIETSTETIGLTQVNADGSVVDLADGTDFIGRADAFDPTITEYSLRNELSDGQSLIITETDAAGNQSGTYVVLNDGTRGRDLSNGNLNNYDIETIELSVMDNTQLTQTEADILALSGNTDTVSVRGGADDSIDITGATKLVDPVSEGGVDYNVYTLGDATIYIEDEILSTNITI